jgi:hypothetical protein
MRRPCPQASVEQPEKYVTVTGFDFLAVVAAYALFRWAKDFFDHRRARNETELARQRLDLIQALTEQDGLPPKEAQAVVAALLKSIEKRTEDDPALRKTLALLGKDKPR